MSAELRVLLEGWRAESEWFGKCGGEFNNGRRAGLLNAADQLHTALDAQAVKGAQAMGSEEEVVNNIDGMSELCAPIEFDVSMDREYIPMPGGWEIQTKGAGSTFRICEVANGQRLAIPDSPYLHETLIRMARDVNTAARTYAKGSSK